MVADEMYYPGDPDRLRALLQQALGDSRTIPGTARIVVAPYGAYNVTLNYVMQALRAAAAGRPQAVMVLAAPHAIVTERFLLPESDAFATPFGTLPVDTRTLHQFNASSPLFEFDEYAHLRDHSIELMLPILHYLFGPIPILPVLVGSLTPEILRDGTDILRGALESSDILTVVSANLSGFTTPREADARSRRLIRLILDSPGDSILDTMETMEDPPRSLWPILCGHVLAGAAAQPLILGRGTFETEYEGDTGTVQFASIAYT